MPSDACCTPAAPCRRCRLWDEIAAGVPLDELRPCAYCEEPWPAESLDARTRLCPACVEEVRERQARERPEPELYVPAEIEEMRRYWESDLPINASEDGRSYQSRS